MKVAAPSLCVLAGAGLASAFIAPPIPIGRQLYASPRRASQRDTIVASGESSELEPVVPSVLRVTSCALVAAAVHPLTTATSARRARPCGPTKAGNMSANQNM